MTVNRNENGSIDINVSIDEAKTISKALRIDSRLTIGQFGEIIWNYFEDIEAQTDYSRLGNCDRAISILDENMISYGTKHARLENASHEYGMHIEIEKAIVD